MKVSGRFGVGLAAFAAIALALTGCDSQGADGDATAPAPGEADSTFSVITHGAAGDAFWDVVKVGAEQAGEDLGVSVSYQGSGNADEQADLINAAVADKTNGIVVSMANPDALREPISKAIAAGVPVITINSGQAESVELGALAHVGQDETVAGQGAGTELAKAGVTKLLCVVHEAGNIGLEQRCAGATSTLGGEVVNLQVNISNIAEAESTIASKLQADSSIDGVLALNPAIGVAASDATAKANSAAKVATFDLNADVIDAVLADKILFAVDQQQYLQGYLPIVMLNLYTTNANTVGGGQPVLTGPGFVTKDNAALVKDLTAKGTR